MLAGLRLNYEVEELQFDSLRNEHELSIVKKMDFFIRLNRAGRRILLSPPLPGHQRINLKRQKCDRGDSAISSVHHINQSRRQISHKSKMTAQDGRDTRQQVKQKPDEEWFQVLEKAGEDLDVLFWIVRESAERFDANARGRQSKSR